MITATDLVDAGGVLDDLDLTTEAAKAAAEVLAVNWVDAMESKCKLASLTKDVDGVIALLQKWREHVLQLTPA